MPFPKTLGNNGRTAATMARAEFRAVAALPGILSYRFPSRHIHEDPTRHLYSLIHPLRAVASQVERADRGGTGRLPMRSQC